MSHSPLPGRLGNLFEAHRATLSLINRLSRLSAQPGSSPLAGDGGDARLELTAEIHQGLKEQEDTLELLKQEVDDYIAKVRGVERESERARLEASVARIGEDLKL
jgi:protein transport protein SEC20